MGEKANIVYDADIETNIIQRVSWEINNHPSNELATSMQKTNITAARVTMKLCGKDIHHRYGIKTSCA